MATKTYNPYAFAQDVFSDGMDYVIQNLPENPQMQDLTDAVAEYAVQWIGQQAGPGGSGSGMSGIVPLPAPLEILFNSLIPTTTNDYINMKIGSNLNATGSQLRIISAVLAGISYNSSDSLNNFFDNVEDQIACCDCGNTNKASLFMATAIARASNNYWMEVLNDPASSPWAPYLSTNWNVNYINLPIWISSSFLGALSGFSQFQAAGLGQSNILNSLGVIAGQAGTLVSALGLSSGKIIFQLPQGPAKNC